MAKDKARERPDVPRTVNVVSSGVMPLPDMYELLRANLDYVGAVHAARRVLADERSAEVRRET